MFGIRRSNNFKDTTAEGYAEHETVKCRLCGKPYLKSGLSLCPDCFENIMDGSKKKKESDA